MKTFDQYVNEQGGWLGNVASAVGNFASNMLGRGGQPAQPQQPGQQMNTAQPAQQQINPQAIQKVFQSSGWVKQHVDELAAAIASNNQQGIQTAHMKIAMLQRASDEVFNGLKGLSQPGQQQAPKPQQPQPAGPMMPQQPMAAPQPGR